MKIDFIQLDTVSSTSTWARENSSKLNPSHLTCITAKEQTAGRGRQNRKWLSPKDANLYTTFYFTLPENAPYLANLGQIMTLSCAELLLQLKVPTQIKWPNDLLVNKKKVGGVLTETFPIKNRIAASIGLGLNVNMPEDLLQTIDKPATSLHLILHKQIEPLSLLDPLLKLFTSHLALLQSEGFVPFQKRFLELLAFQGEPITVHLPNKTIHGICNGITIDGRLQILLPIGDLVTLSAGEIL